MLLHLNIAFSFLLLLLSLLLLFICAYFYLFDCSESILRVYDDNKDILMILFRLFFNVSVFVTIQYFALLNFWKQSPSLELTKS